MSSSSFEIQRTKREGEKGGCKEFGFEGFSERVSSFSLDFWLIRSSDSFRPRRKAVLHGEGNAWTPVLRSFDKLREVEVLSYLVLLFVQVFCDY